MLGLDGGFTRRARRSIGHVGVDTSFDRGARPPRASAGWSGDAETIRRLCHAAAKACRGSKAERRDVAANFGEATGDGELPIDAGKVHTETGGRDVKVATVAVREPAEPCPAEDLQARALPRPSVRHGIAGIEAAAAFGPRCKAEAGKVGLPDVKGRTALGDGGAWIWNLSGEPFAAAGQAPDLDHAPGYLADLARAGCGGDTAAAAAWTRHAQLARVADGWAGVGALVHGSQAEWNDPPALESASPRVANSPWGHQDRRTSAARLRRGASVGSGRIEGAINHLVGRRIQPTGARWKTDHLGPMVELIRLGPTEDWDTSWSDAA